MTTSLDAPVTLQTADGVARLRLNRPDASNGLNVEILKALHEAILACHADPAVRVVLLSGEGRNFCAGGDIKTFESKGEALPEYLREATAWLQLATAALIQLRAPVITAVQGFAAGGGGLGLVCASDLVVAGRSAKFFSGAVRVGMAPDGGSSVTLAQLVGLRQALRILLTNPTLSAQEAADIGLYRKTRVRVSLLSGEEVAWLYVLDAYEGGLPSANYLSVLADAAEAGDAPSDYVAGLRRRECRSNG